MVATTGRVMALEANFCRVVLDGSDSSRRSQLLCTRRTRLGKSGLQVVVGDRVRIDAIDWAAGRGAVAHVEPRQTLLPRPAVANVSRVLVVVALAEPQPDALQLTRFLLAAEATGQEVLLVFTKADLVPPAHVWEWCGRVKGWGYEPLVVSPHTGQGLAQIRQSLSLPGITVLCGPSGVGKSSLLNALIPELALRVGKVSGRLQRGRHTTRHVELFPLAEGALIADSPGFNRPHFPSEPTALAALFPEVRQRLRHHSCFYRNCLHRGDPGCVVGTDWDRHAHYASCLAELLVQKSVVPEKESGMRVRGGRVEPRLDPQLRQSSRRRVRQGLGADDDSGSLSQPPDLAG